MTQIDNVSVVKKANVYFDGKCVSHTVLLADGVRKSVGVVLPASLVFTTAAPEVMECVGGSCRVRQPGEADWTVINVGQSFSVPGDASFEIECSEPFHYVCHYG